MHGMRAAGIQQDDLRLPAAKSNPALQDLPDDARASACNHACTTNLAAPEGLFMPDAVKAVEVSTCLSRPAASAAALPDMCISQTAW